MLLGCVRLLFHETERLLFAPLAAFYTHGPRWMGAWEGAEDATVCAHIGNGDASFWAEHADECARMIERRVASHVVVLRAVVYVYLLSTVATRFLIVRPAVADLARALETVEKGGKHRRTATLR